MLFKFAFCCCHKHHNQKHLEEESVYFILYFQVKVLKEVGARIQSKAYGELLTGALLTFLGSLKSTCPGWHCSQWTRLSHINQ